MRLLILSDLHHELWREFAPRIDPARSRPDAVILAGDIDSGARGVAWAERTFPGLPVFYVHGNHEGYGHDLDTVQLEMEAASQAAGNVLVLNCGEQIIGNVRFLGATLWTDFRLFGDDTRHAAMQECEALMNDYRRIGLAAKSRKLNASDTAQFHARQRHWLERKLDQPFAGKTVVVTHMAPSMRSVAGRFRTMPVSAAYASRLESLVERADLWVHGHMHTSFDYTVGKCRVLCNPCGYMTRGGTPENPRFDPDFIVDVA